MEERTFRWRRAAGALAVLALVASACSSGGGGSPSAPGGGESAAPATSGPAASGSAAAGESPSGGTGSFACENIGGEVTVYATWTGAEQDNFDAMMAPWLECSGVSMNYTGQRDLAEDLAQEVFLRVYRARASYVPGAKFSTWLFTIAGNVASNAKRSKSRRREVHIAPLASDSAPQSLESMALAASGLMPTRQLDKSEMCVAVQQAISSLNDRQRMAVLLAKFEHLSYADIGEIMDMTPQAIKSLLSRARFRRHRWVSLDQGSRTGLFIGAAR